MTGSINPFNLEGGPQLTPGAEIVEKHEVSRVETCSYGNGSTKVILGVTDLKIGEGGDPTVQYRCSCCNKWRPVSAEFKVLRKKWLKYEV